MIRVFRYTRVCAVHTQFLLFRRHLPNRLTRRQRHRHYRPGRQQHPNRLPRNPQPAGCRQRSRRQDYRLHLRRTRQPHQHHRPRRLHHPLRLQRPMAARNHNRRLRQNPTPTLRHPRSARLLYRLYRRNHPFRLHRIRRSRNCYRCAGPYHPPPLRRSRQPRPYRLPPDGSHETFEYDRLNRLTAYIDGLGAKTAYELAADTNNRWSW